METRERDRCGIYLNATRRLTRRAAFICACDITRPGLRAMVPGALEPEPMAPNAKTTDVDRKIGALIRSHRLDAGWTLSALAKEISITRQQVHSYEVGASRVSASRLLQIAETLQKPVASFYPDTNKTARW
jgi:DNA-binding XRE family transcriptional regulator